MHKESLVSAKMPMAVISVLVAHSVCFAQTNEKSLNLLQELETVKEIVQIRYYDCIRGNASACQEMRELFAKSQALEKKQQDCIAGNSLACDEVKEEANAIKRMYIEKRSQEIGKEIYMERQWHQGRDQELMERLPGDPTTPPLPYR